MEVYPTVTTSSVLNFLASVTFSHFSLNSNATIQFDSKMYNVEFLYRALE